MTLYALSSLFVAVMVIEKGPKSGVILFVAAVILGLLLVPNKLGMLPYICFFGYYGVLKFYFEKIRKPAGQVLVKLLFFAVLLIAALGLTDGLLLGNLDVPAAPVAVLYVGGLVILFLYDWIYTLFIKIYRQRFQRRPEPGFQLYKDDE